MDSQLTSAPLVLPDPLPADGPVIARVGSLRVGKVASHVWDGRAVESAALKEPQTQRVHLGTEGFAGDEQADRANHGGPEKAVLVYAGAHYPRWHADGLDLPEGAFFENITLHGDSCHEGSVHLGEVWRMGEAVVQVSQPRSPCWKLARKWGVRDLAVSTQTTGRTGWYLRVLTPGTVAAGDEVRRLAIPAGAVSAAEVTRVMNVDKRDLEGARTLLDSGALPPRWAEKLQRRLEKAQPEDDGSRLFGDADAEAEAG